MLDQAGIMMSNGSRIAIERISGVNDNMQKAHYHNYFELYFLEQGERIHQLEASEYEMHPGGLALFPPYSMHFSYGKKDVTFQRLVLYFAKDLILGDEHYEELCKAGGFYLPGSREILEIKSCFQILLSEQESRNRYAAELQQHTLNALLLRILRLRKESALSIKASGDPFTRILDYIHHHYQESISIQQLASLIYVSPYYLCRLFKKKTNLTVTQYINYARIMNAQRQFQETTANVSEVGLACGFNNLTHFNRVFKEITGMTPSGYRKSVRYTEAMNNAAV